MPPSHGRVDWVRQQPRLPSDRWPGQRNHPVVGELLQAPVWAVPVLAATFHDAGKPPLAVAPGCVTTVSITRSRRRPWRARWPVFHGLGSVGLHQISL